MTTFTDLKLSAPLLQALATEGYETPTPIQAQAIPPLLEGRDLLGIAQTGTGKTAAFALPLLQRLTSTDRRAAPRTCRALILTPTRELCVQILDSFRSYGRHLRLSRVAIYGGVSQGPQVQALSRGVDVLVATPGRLLDLMNQGQVKFDGLEAFVLDEADRMLDMGFIVPVKRIVAKLPQQRQTLMFSATMPQAVHGLVAGLLKDPVRVEVTPAATTVERIAQKVHFVEKANKRALLESLLGDKAISRVLVFTRTKHGANKVAESLAKAGVRADAIHGNKSQNARQKALNDFRNGKVRVLVATDIAARGIDVDGVSHVINYDLPNEPESYVHRIGRTARAGSEGIAISFCDSEERGFLRDIERTIRQPVPVDAEHPFHAPHIAEGKRGGSSAAPARGGRSHNGGSGHGKPSHGGRSSGSGRSAEGGRPSHGHHRGAESRAEGEGSRGRRPDRDHRRDDQPRDGQARDSQARDSQARDTGHPHSQARTSHANGDNGHRGGQRHAQPAGERPARQEQSGRGPSSHASAARVDSRNGDTPPRRSNNQHGPNHRGQAKQGKGGQPRAQRFEPVRMG